MSEEKEKALELKYAPGKCSHFIMGECMISKYNKSCGIDCDTCDTYYYYKQLQTAKKENETLTQQNKQMRGLMSEIRNMINPDGSWESFDEWEQYIYKAVDKIDKLQQELNEVNNEK